MHGLTGNGESRPWRTRSRICAISTSRGYVLDGRASSSARLLRTFRAIFYSGCWPIGALGDLDAATIRLLKQIAAGGTKMDSVALTAEFDHRRSELKPGTILMREWNGRPERVRVIDEGFAWKGKTYDSLSSVAFAITGTKWNGPRFFGLRDKQPDQAAIGVKS
jgi:hypothetical protein